MEEEIKVAIPPVIYEDESPIAYTYRFIGNWRRKNVGTYPKWFANPAKKILRFCFKHFLKHYHIEFVLRGRGTRKINIAGVNPQMFNQDLPVRYAKKVAVYVSIIRR
jgi:hypothetical protein